MTGVLHAAANVVFLFVGAGVVFAMVATVNEYRGRIVSALKGRGGHV